jgi:hypothetical protein
MELITILNRCHRFRGFVYQTAHFSADRKSVEVAVRPRKGSGRSLLALPFALHRGPLRNVSESERARSKMID